ncbi:ATP-binding protein [Lacinutrix sp. Bg11-31]|uniref:tetratricopeptide repeat-containing sensor histidine kinase n=1 Tax=Lacinutrix sp. Bg11-31 TaxID=2057808 RepID=UPI000C310F9B|nr:ATP-binding protein [Lacinutrix sp. Bg11-31]AUC82195.1 hypothetical protein CW733_08660 [Lacinutrix sp. Bg11-31]
MRHFHKYLFFYVLAFGLTTKVFSSNVQDSIANQFKTKVSQTNANEDKAELLFLLAERYSNLNKADSAFKYYNQSLKLSKELGLRDRFMECNKELFQLLDSQNQLNIDPLPYLDSYFNYAKVNNDNKKLLEAKLDYASYYFNPTNYKKSKAYYLDALNDAKAINDSYTQAKINTNLGLLYSGFIAQDSARLFFEKALKLYKTENVNALFSTYFNYANSYQKDKEYIKAIEYLKKAEAIALTKYKNNYQKNLYAKLTICYKHLNDYQNAYNAFEKYNTVRDSINVTSQNIAISEIKEQYDNEKLRGDNLESEAKRKQTQNLLFAAIGFLVFGGITAFLIQKNTKRKQLLAEQESKLKTQKLATVLKEQELTSIDAMIEGQEKERQRIANELHDDLGGLMATVKLHFNVLKEKQSPDLFNKTNVLLDEAYKKVRSIAHAKNSGVIAKQGLLKAIKDMAKKISGANKIQIEVIDHGLENRLENSLEITLFRIIQELVTNTIKHSKASQVTIHLTNHENSLNIMVEDNGIGFNTKNISKEGMGIHSIDKRVEHLEGNMTIESEINKGTSIIIDIPI